MTQLTEHEKSILKAIIDDKQIEGRIRRGGEWDIVSRFYAMRELENPNVELRLKQKTHSINGVGFPAPVEGGDYPLQLSANNYSLIRKWTFATEEGRNAAVVALINAMEGK